MWSISIAIILAPHPADKYNNLYKDYNTYQQCILVGTVWSFEGLCLVKKMDNLNFRISEGKDTSSNVKEEDDDDVRMPNNFH